MKKYALVVALVLTLSRATIFAATGTASEPDRFWYVAWNPVAALSFFNLGFANALVPVLGGNLEYGVAMAGGYTFDRHTFKGRLSYETSSGVFDVSMIQASYHYRFEQSLAIARGLYGGANLRMWDLDNRLTGIDNYNINAALACGYWLPLGRFFIDVRLTQSVYLFSWNSLEHSRSAGEFIFSSLPKISPVMPSFCVNIGIRL